MPSVRCPACDEDMEIEADWYGRKVACPSCGKQFVARRPGAAGADEDEPDARPKRRRAWDDDDDEDDDDRPKKKKPVRRERPLPMGRGTKQLILAASILGPILLCCLGCGGFGAFVIYSPVKYPDPWVTQALPDGTYSVQFPKPPDPPLFPFGDPDDLDPDGNGDSEYEYTEDPPKDAVFRFGMIEAGPSSFEVTYQMEVQHLRLMTNAKRMTETSTTVLGRPCKQAEFSSGGGKVVYRLVDVSEPGRPRFVSLMAGGRNVSDADRNKFLDSLRQGR